MMTFNFTGEGIAAIVASISALGGTVITGILQLRQAKLSAVNTQKLVVQDQKMDEQTEKLDAVHAATNVLVASATGSHQVYKQ